MTPKAPSAKLSPEDEAQAARAKRTRIEETQQNLRERTRSFVRSNVTRSSLLTGARSNRSGL